MATTTAIGHTKNVDNLDTLISKVDGFGTAFNPSKDSLKLEALQQLSEAGRKVVSAEHSAVITEKFACDKRKVGFKILSPTVSRSMNALRASGASPEQIEAAQMFARRILGTSSSAKKKDAAPADGTADAKPSRRNISQRMDYESRLDNFDLFIKQLSSIKEYNPNEPELKVSGLTDLYNDLKTKNTAAVNAITLHCNARIARNETLYRDATGLVGIALDTKLYIKSVFGSSSPQYKQIAKLLFKKI